MIIVSFFGMLAIIFFRNWTLKRNNYEILLIISMVLSLIGNVFGFLIYKRGTIFGVLNGPLISLLIYKFLYDWFSRKYKKILAHPFDTYLSGDMGLMKDGFLNAFFVISSIFATAIFGALTHGF